jgi:hypothetical protein
MAALATIPTMDRATRSSGEPTMLDITDSLARWVGSEPRRTRKDRPPKLVLIALDHPGPGGCCAVSARGTVKAHPCRASATHELDGIRLCSGHAYAAEHIGWERVP